MGLSRGTVFARSIHSIIPPLSFPFHQGRYIVAPEVHTFVELARAVEKELPRYPLPKITLYKWVTYLIAPIAGMTSSLIHHNCGHRPVVSCERIKQHLGFQFRSVAQGSRGWERWRRREADDWMSQQHLWNLFCSGH